MKFEVKNLSFSYNTVEVLKDISFTLNTGDEAILLGPNGVGKTTLFKIILGLLKEKKGSIMVDGVPLCTLSRKERSKIIAYIPQSFAPIYNHSVLDSVLMGLGNEISLFSVPKKEEEERAEKILDSLGILNLKDRGIQNISGGERQLVLLGRALIQNAKILIMDEPTANLDYGNSWLLLKRLNKLKDEGYIILYSSHEPDYAFSSSTRVLALKDGVLIKDGEALSSLDEETLQTLYGITIERHQIKLNGEERIVCIQK